MDVHDYGHHMEVHDYADRNRRRYEATLPELDRALGELLSSLKSAGLLEVRKGAGKADRAWFLLPKEPVVDTSLGHRNNVSYPS